MRARIRIVGPTHYVTIGGDPLEKPTAVQRKLQIEAYRFLRRSCRTPANGAVVATYRGKLVAFFRFRKTQSKLHAVGTWVKPDWRGRGLATMMWRKALAENVRKVEVLVVSHGGRALVRKMRAERKDVRFLIERASHL